MKYIIALASCVLALCLSACHKYKDEPSTEFDIVRTKYPSVYQGGEGFIQLTTSEVEVSTDATWLTAKLTDDQKVVLSLSPNLTDIERVGNVILKKGSVTKRVPITQLAQVNDATSLTDISWDQNTHTTEFDVNFGSNPIITISQEDSWLTYEYTSGKLKFIAQELPTRMFDRSTTVRIQAGLFDRTITITQRKVYAYEYFIGDYTLVFKNPQDNTFITTDATITAGADKQSFVLTSPKLPLPIKLAYDSATLTFRIHTQVLDKPAGATSTDEYLLAAMKTNLNNLMPDINSKNYGALAVLSPGETIKLQFGLMNPAFSDYPILGFLKQSNNQYYIFTSDGTYSFISELTLTKKSN